MRRSLILLAIFLLCVGCVLAGEDYLERIVPEIKLEKSKYVLGESIRFWVGAKTKDGSSVAWPEHTLYITRPNGTIKVVRLASGVDGVSESSSFEEGAGLGEDPQLGKYTLVFEILGQKTNPLELYVEDLHLSKFVRAEFIIDRSKKYSISDKVPFALCITNVSNDIIRFQAPGSMGAELWVVFQRNDGGREESLYPHDKLLDKQFQNSKYVVVKDIYDWEAATFMPTITLNPGGVYKKDLWLNEVYQFDSLHPGKYKVILSTVLPVLVGEEGGEYADFCPIRFPLESVIALEIREVQ